jgi:hypothetical protein
MLIGASCVPNVHNGFYYFINGFHAVFENYGSETKACMGFVIAGFVIAYIPFICVLPVFYFFLANFIIFEVLSEKFQNVTFVKYRKWAYFIHSAEIAVLGLVIPGIILLTAGYSPFYYPSLFGAFGNLFQPGAKHLIGIAIILHFGIGYVFAVIIVGWVIFMALAWVFGQIRRFFTYVGKIISDARQRRLELKLERKKAKQKE